MSDLIKREDLVKELNAQFAVGDITREIVNDILNHIPSAEPDNQVHLCDSCHYGYPVCPAVNNDVIFGNGKGHDNICACAKYIPSAGSVRKAKVMKHKYWFGVSLNVVGEQIICYEWICENCKKKVLNGDDYCSHCGVKLDWSK